MNYTNFYELDDYMTTLLDKKNYEDAIKLLHDADKLLPEDEVKKSRFNLLFSEAYIYTQTKNIEGCIALIKNSIKEGCSFPLHWGYFDFLSDHSEYESLKKSNLEVLEKDKTASEFKYEVQLPKSYDSNKKYPLFFCLHGDGFDCNKDNSIWNWEGESLLEKGYILVYPQSSQVYFHKAFGWLTDPVLSRKELKDCYEKLLSEYSIDESQIIVGGFSGGATTAIDLALHNTLPIRGVVSLCPGDYLDKLEVKPASDLAARETKIFILDGEEGSDPAIEHILNIFKQSNVTHEYIVNKGVGHAFPKDFKEKLSMAVDFIVN